MKTLVNYLRGRATLSIPRYYAHITGNLVSRYLCEFCDASTKAYAAVVYIVSVTDRCASVKFVAAETQVTVPSNLWPYHVLSCWPSSSGLARLITTVKNSLCSIWHAGDKIWDALLIQRSPCIGFKEWKPFVRNRVLEIRDKVPPECWSQAAWKAR